MATKLPRGVSENNRMCTRFKWCVISQRTPTPPHLQHTYIPNMLSRGAFSWQNLLSTHPKVLSLNLHRHTFININPPPQNCSFSLQRGKTSGVSAAAEAAVETQKPSLADQLRLESLTEDGFSYKEKFIVRCYEVGLRWINLVVLHIMNFLLEEVGRSFSKCYSIR